MCLSPTDKAKYMPVCSESQTNRSQDDMNFRSGAAESPGQRAAPKDTLRQQSKGQAILGTLFVFRFGFSLFLCPDETGQKAPGALGNASEQKTSRRKQHQGSASGSRCFPSQAATRKHKSELGSVQKPRTQHEALVAEAPSAQGT